MKLRFESDLDFQLQAIDAVCDLFRGQQVGRVEFTIAPDTVDTQGNLAYTETHLGVGNRLTLHDEQLLNNLREIQRRHGLPLSEALVSGDFSVDMETGTGKTYVYLRTILELHRRYGFIKFVIVVPSVAIKEGVYKSLRITEEHFKRLYSGIPVDYFLYDSSKLGQLRNFATNQQIQIMVVTVGAINKKDVNNLYKSSERTGGEKPIELIRATRPILIVDEPQSVDGGLQGRGKEALNAMNPLCTLRYSATHTDRHHMIYRLDAIDAYERKLVKQIEVAGATVEDAHNRPYVRVLSTGNRNGVITARVEIDAEIAGGVRRTVRAVQDGDDLEEITGRAIYRDCRIGEIRVDPANEFLELRVPGHEAFLRPGEAWGDVDAVVVQQEMIRRTIREHLDKEKLLRPQGIKVLSLFFIDAVDRYRRYDGDGNPMKGEYALMFEEEYRRLARHPDYRTLFDDVDLDSAVTQVHNGYFSIDRTGGWTDTAENSQTGRDNAERAYTLIMRDKERLLSLETPLKFIFSHSALREGWDNPNVFQICALREVKTERDRRQIIGRGLRLCVNQKGERQRGFDLNTLTVVARESYEEFAEKLQHELEQDTGIRFGIVERHLFASLVGVEDSQALWEQLQAEGHIDSQGRIRDSLRRALREESFEVPPRFSAYQNEIAEELRKRAGGLAVRNADERRHIRPRQAVLHSPEFKELWDRIKYKTFYRLEFDNERLLRDCIHALKEAPPIPRPRLRWRKADLAIARSGVDVTETSGAAPVVLDDEDVELPDILTELTDRTWLTRRSVCRILLECGRLEDFKRNPQRFMELAAQILDRCKQRAVVDGIRYQRLGDDHYYGQELFETEELTGYLKNVLPANKAIFEAIIYESDIEARFADDLEKNTAVKVYAKLPHWFTVPTPIGDYTPDWAVLFDSDDGERLYLVVETKGSVQADDLRRKEAEKIRCSKEHFKALANRDSPAQYEVATSFEDLLAGLEP